MGLAERFKDKLKDKDIYKKTEQVRISETPKQEKPESIQDLTFISIPISETDITETKPKVVIQKNSSYKFENLETEIIEKIRKTPYWNEYTTIRQEKMISGYFDQKATTKYSNIQYSDLDRTKFIQNILALANNI